LGLGSAEGILHVFETSRPEDEIARLQHTGEVTAIAFSDDSRYVATASSARHPNHLDEEESFPLRIWLLQPADLITEAQGRLAASSKKPCPLPPASRLPPNPPVEPTPNSFCSCVAPAIGRGSPPAFGFPFALSLVAC